MDSPTDVVPSPGAQVPPPGPRRLRRRPDDGYISGVCAGVAEYFDVDPLIVRIVMVALTFSGPGIFAYVLAWIFVPAVPGHVEPGAAQAPIDRKDRWTQIFGGVLIVLAVSAFWGDWWSPARHWLLPLGLMGLGGWLLLRRSDDEPSPPVPPSTPTPPPAAWAWGSGDLTVPAPVEGSDGTETGAEDAGGSGDPTVVGDVTTTIDPTTPLVPEAAAGDGGEPPTPAPWDAPPMRVPPPPGPAIPAVPPTPSRRRVLGPIVFGALLVWAGIAVLAGVTVETGLAGALLILGSGFVLGAFVGGSRLLILPALLVGAALAVTAIIDIPLEGPIGQQRWAPTSLASLDDTYAVSLGEGTLDLSGVTIPAGERIELETSVGVGHLVVLVPQGPAVDVTTEVGAGESDVFGLQQNGVDVSTDQYVPGDDASGTLALDLHVGVGQVEVRRSAFPTTTTTTSTTVLG
jgi:phage shock protein PspC (stress-responsive transcriptional regulator)